MKIIITGSRGFIGSHLAEFLVNKGHKIIIIDNLSTGRLNNIKSFKKTSFKSLIIQIQYLTLA